MIESWATVYKNYCQTEARKNLPEKENTLRGKTRQEIRIGTTAPALDSSLATELHSSKHPRSLTKRKTACLTTIKWFSSYLRCSVNGKLSTARTLSCGLPQGSIPLLFLIYINDLPNSLHWNAVPRMFADGTNLTLSARTLTELDRL